MGTRETGKEAERKHTITGGVSTELYTKRRQSINCWSGDGYIVSEVSDHDWTWVYNRLGALQSQKVSCGHDSFLHKRIPWSPQSDHSPPTVLVRLEHCMKGMCAHFNTIKCGPEITRHPVYIVATVLPLPTEHHESLPVTAGIVCSLNK